MDDEMLTEKQAIAFVPGDDRKRVAARFVRWRKRGVLKFACKLPGTNTWLYQKSSLLQWLSGGK